jgi:hypothetical protein
MKIVAIILTCFALCSCANHHPARLQIGDDPTWITWDDAIRLAQELLATKGYPDAKCVSSEVAGKDCQFVFQTQDTLRVLVHVDRKSKHAKIVQWIHLKQSNQTGCKLPLLVSQD